MVKGTLWLDSEETVFCFEYKALGRRKRQKIFLKGKLSLQMNYLQLYITIGPACDALLCSDRGVCLEVDEDYCGQTILTICINYLSYFTWRGCVFFALPNI